MPRVALIVPCYNEAERLDRRAFATFCLADHDLDVVFVNDGSTDRTAEVLDELCSTDGDHLRCIHLEKNAGKAEAVRAGVRAALADDFDYIGYWDADLATPLEELSRFCEVLDHHPDVDLVLGARVKMLGRRIDRRTYRHVYGRVFATLVSQMLALPVYDTQCGAKLFRVTEETPMIFDRPFVSRWIFDVELLARYIEAWEHQAREAADHIHEVPLRSWKDIGGSKVKPRDGLVAGVDLLRIGERHRASLTARHRRRRSG